MYKDFKFPEAHYILLYLHLTISSIKDADSTWITSIKAYEYCWHIPFINCFVFFGRKVTMALSEESLLLLTLNCKELCEAINISSSLLIDHLREHDVITQEEDELIRVMFH